MFNNKYILQMKKWLILPVVCGATYLTYEYALSHNVSSNSNVQEIDNKFSHERFPIYNESLRDASNDDYTPLPSNFSNHYKFRQINSPIVDLNNKINLKLFQVKNGDIYMSADGIGLFILEKGLFGEEEFKQVTSSKISNGGSLTFLQSSVNDDLYVAGKGTGLEILKGGILNSSHQFESVSNTNITNGDRASIIQIKNGDIITADGVGSSQSSGFKILVSGVYDSDHQFQDLTISTATGDEISYGVDGGAMFVANNGDLYVAGRGTSSSSSQNLVFAIDGDSISASDLSSYTNAQKVFPDTKTSDYFIWYSITQSKGSDDLYLLGGLNGVSDDDLSSNQVKAIRGGDFTSGSSQIENAGVMNGTTLNSFSDKPHFLDLQSGGNVFGSPGGDLMYAADGSSLITSTNTRINLSDDFSFIQSVFFNDVFVYDGTNINLFKNGDMNSEPIILNLEDNNIDLSRNARNLIFFEAFNGQMVIWDTLNGMYVSDSKVDIEVDSVPPSNIGVSDGIITITNWEDDNSLLQYKLKGTSQWADVELGMLSNISEGEYEFQWIPKDWTKPYIGGYTSIHSESYNFISRITPPQNSVEYTVTVPSTKGDADAKINLTNWENNKSQLQYRKEDATEWINVTSQTISGLTIGNYKFRWIGKNGEYFVGHEQEVESVTVNISDSNKIKNPSTDVSFVIKKPSITSKSDGSIQLTNWEDTYSKLQYRLKTDENTESWVGVESSIISGLSIGQYEFQWIGKNDETYSSNSNQYLDAGVVDMTTSEYIEIPQDISYSYKNVSASAKDGYFRFYENWQIEYAQLQFKKPNSSDWNDVEDDRLFEMGYGKYSFRWVSKQGELFEGTTETFYNLFDKELIHDEDIPLPFYNPIFTKNNILVIGEDSGSIAIENWDQIQDDWSDLVYRNTSDDDWTKMETETIENLRIGTYEFRWMVGSIERQYYQGQDSNDASSKYSFIDSIELVSMDIINIPTGKPTFSYKTTTTKTSEDGVITIRNFADNYSHVQYRLKTDENNQEWKDIPANGKIENLRYGVYEFQWVPKNKSTIYQDGTSFQKIKEFNLPTGSIVNESNKMPTWKIASIASGIVLGSAFLIIMYIIWAKKTVGKK